MPHMPAAGGGRRQTTDSDRALSVSLPSVHADTAGALLMDRLGPYEERGGEEGRSTLVFYPARHGCSRVTERTVRGLLPAHGGLREGVTVEWHEVPRDWEEGWRDHFRPLVVGEIYIRPPWAEPGPSGLHDVMINPGLAFGTGLHPTTRGVLALLQRRSAAAGGSPAAGPLVDVGTGSGILAIAAAKLGFGPVTAFDVDPLAVQAATANAVANDVRFDVYEADLADVPLGMCGGAVILANLTEGPVLQLLRRFASGDAAPARPRRVVVAGILAGSQQESVTTAGVAAGFAVADSCREGEWVSLDLWPAAS